MGRRLPALRFAFSLIRAALLIVLCLAAISCGGSSNKTLGEQIQGSDSYQKRHADEVRKSARLREVAASQREGECGDEDPPYSFPGGAPWPPDTTVFRVHGVECRTARVLLNTFIIEGKAPGYTCRGTIFCWRGASAANAKHSAHWFSVSPR